MNNRKLIPVSESSMQEKPDFAEMVRPLIETIKAKKIQRKRRAQLAERCNAIFQKKMATPAFFQFQYKRKPGKDIGRIEAHFYVNNGIAKRFLKLLKDDAKFELKRAEKQTLNLVKHYQMYLHLTSHPQVGTIINPESFKSKRFTYEESSVDG
jgi:hypothetical protein